MSATIPPTHCHTIYFALIHRLLTIVKNSHNIKFCPLTSDVCGMTTHSPSGQYHFSAVNIKRSITWVAGDMIFIKRVVVRYHERAISHQHEFDKIISQCHPCDYLFIIYHNTRTNRNFVHTYHSHIYYTRTHCHFLTLCCKLPSA